MDFFFQKKGNNRINKTYSCRVYSVMIETKRKKLFTKQAFRLGRRRAAISGRSFPIAAVLTGIMK